MVNFRHFKRIVFKLELGINYELRFLIYRNQLM